jgi:hypothetical protein
MCCPACSSASHTDTATAGVYTCSKCDALYGRTYLGQSYALVQPYFYEGPDPDPSEWRCFDLTCLGSKGITRRHGWYEPKSRLILQVG